MQMLLAVMVVASIGSEYAKVEEKKEIPIGSKVAKLSFTDTRFLVRSLDDFPKRKAFVLVFVDTGCPLVKRYLPILTKMEAEYRKSDVQFIAVGVGNDDIVQDLAALAVEFDVPFPFVRDSHLKCVDALGVESTPEVVVLDAERRIRYRGRIDDQYRPGGSRPAATRNDLKEAIDDVLAAKDVRIASTTVDGCRITRVMTAEEKQPPTFAEHVAPLIHQHCAVCHRSGASAPFSLVTYEEVRSRAKTIVEATADGKMRHHSPLGQEWLASRRREAFSQTAQD
jgi:thiol-disulfide isomerase/thioredoxin